MKRKQLRTRDCFFVVWGDFVGSELQREENKRVGKWGCQLCLKKEEIFRTGWGKTPHGKGKIYTFKYT